MKLDKFKFAQLVNFIGELRPERDIDLYQLDTIVDIEVPPSSGKASVAEVDQLLLCMMTAYNGQFINGQFIEAIRAYRTLTGAGLKEAKEAVERYRQPPVKD